MKDDFEKLVIARQYVNVLEAENKALKEVIQALEREKKQHSADMQQINQELQKLLIPGSKKEYLAYKQNLKIRYLTKQVESALRLAADYKERYRLLKSNISPTHELKILLKARNSKEVTCPK